MLIFFHIQCYYLLIVLVIKYVNTKLNYCKGYTISGTEFDCLLWPHIKLPQGTHNSSCPQAVVSTNWITNCIELHHLCVAGMNLSHIRAILDCDPNIEVLYLKDIPDLDNVMKCPLFSNDGKRNQKIKSLHIIYSFIEAENMAGFMKQLSLLPLLEVLDIGSNFLCALGNETPVHFRSLKSLYAANNEQLCMKHDLIAPELTQIQLSLQARSVAFNLQFGELFSTRAPQLLLNLNGHGQVLNFEFTRDDYLTLYDFQNKEPKKSNVTLLGFKEFIKCDCSGPTFWFARALRAGLVTAPGIFCTDYSAPAEMKCEWIDCDRINCNSTCVCCRDEYDAVTVDCRDVSLTTLIDELLRLPNLTRLGAPNNSIISLPDHLPDTLIQLDLTGNNIWHNVGTTEVSALFSIPTRSLRLAGNHIICSCDNKLLITQLQNSSKQIEDFDSITCGASNMLLRSVNVSQLCAMQDRDKALIKNREITLVAVLGTLIVSVVCLVLAVLIYQRRQKLQIFLFSRGWCLCCITEKQLDADRFYDVFISFCHADTAIVLEELLPPLDRDYSVCLHLRDWCPGEMIPSQIAMSVQQSRRTIVVLSRNFVRSQWGRLEFQTAHVNGLADGRVRVVMIILDDVLEKDQLAPELRSYIRLNTYLRWEDPWFWEKLRYALPHHPTPRRPQIRLQIEHRRRESNIAMQVLEGPEQHNSDDVEH